MKQRLIFTAVTIAAYLLLFRVIVPYWVNNLADISHSPDGMSQAFAYIGGYMWGSIFLLILSLIVAHHWLRHWWMGLVAVAVAMLTAWGVHEFMYAYEMDIYMWLIGIEIDIESLFRKH